MKSKQILICIIFLLTPIMFFAAELQSQKDNQTISVNRDGSSFEKAIIIKYIGDYSKSIGQEYQYLTTKFGIRGKDWELVRQALITREDKSYDEMVIELFPSQEIITLYFDITEPFTELEKMLSTPSE